MTVALSFAFKATTLVSAALQQTCKDKTVGDDPPIEFGWQVQI
jgi:hypothetical protein